MKNTIFTKPDFTHFGAYFGYKLKKLSALGVLMIIFSVLGYPLMFFCLMNSIAAQNAYNVFRYSDVIQNGTVQEYNSFMSQPEYIAAQNNYVFWNGMQIMAQIILAVALTGIFVMSLIVVLKNFRYLYKKQFVDTDCSLPVSEETRFAADFLSGFAVITVPHLVSIFAGQIFLSFTQAKPTGTMYYGLNSEFINNYVGKYMWYGFFACLLFYCINILIITCCGRAREARLMPILLNIAVPLAVGMLTTTAASFYYGVSSSNIRDYLGMMICSPGGILAELLSLLFNRNDGSLAAMFPKFCIGAVIMMIVYTAAAFVLYRMRRTERVGNAFVFKPVKTVFFGVVTLAIVSTFAFFVFQTSKLREYDSYGGNPFSTLVAMIIVSLIIYVVLELISGRGFKKFWRTLVRYIATTAVCFGISVLFLESGGFGMEKYVPNTADVLSVEVSGALREFSYTATNPDDIAAIADCHRQTIAIKTMDTRFGSTAVTILGGLSYTYTLKDGTTVERQYPDSRIISDSLRHIQFNNGAFADGYILPDYAFTGAIEYHNNDPEIKSKNVQTDIEQFRAALETDAHEMTYDMLYNENNFYSDMYYVSTVNVDVEYYPEGDRYKSYYMLIIPKTFERTLALLDNAPETGDEEVYTKETETF